MQEEVENRTLTLTVNAAKFTGRVLKAVLSKYLAHRKNKKLQNSRDSPDDVKPYGRVSMEDLKKQYGDMKEIDLQDKGLRSFDRIAREYKVQYAVYKTAKGQYQIFFKAPSEASMNAAFQKYSKNRLKKEQRRESVLGKLKAEHDALVERAKTDPEAAQQLAEQRKYQSEAAVKSYQKMKAAAEAGDPEAIKRYEAHLAKRREDYHKKKEKQEAISA